MLQLGALVGRLRWWAPLLVLAMPLGSLAAGADAAKGLERVDLAPLAKGDAVLEVTTPGGPLAYDLATIEELGIWRLTTPSPYDDGSPTFEGVLLSDLLAKDGLADAKGVELSAADGYSQVIPREDWETYPVLLATRQDGAPLVDRGPLRIIYPVSGYPELAAELYQPRWVWQIKSIKAVDH